jgi:hypothetical protein
MEQRSQMMNCNDVAYLTRAIACLQKAKRAVRDTRGEQAARHLQEAFEWLHIQSVCPAPATVAADSPQKGDACTSMT